MFSLNVLKIANFEICYNFIQALLQVALFG
jgi:hypothetical protein